MQTLAALPEVGIQTFMTTFKALNLISKILFEYLKIA